MDTSERKFAKALKQLKEDLPIQKYLLNILERLNKILIYTDKMKAKIIDYLIEIIIIAKKKQGVKKMNAKKMFEQLGYKCDEPLHGIGIGAITYTKPNEMIVFSKEFKMVKTQIGTLSKNISIAELKAIIQQCKELGWLNE